MAPYRLEVVSLVPQAFDVLNGLGVIGKALKSKIAQINIYNPRDYTTDNYQKVDDHPFGGGSGMVLKPEPIFKAFESIPVNKTRRTILLSPQGKVLSQADLYRWANSHEQLVIICGHYEGFDERIRSLADEEISIGDFVLTGGELPAMIIINGVIRLLPGTIGKAKSLVEESHADLLLEHPQFTRPADFRGMKVPDILRSGHHENISKWKNQQRELKTKKNRPDLFLKWLSKQSLDNDGKGKIIQSSKEIPNNKENIYYPDW